MGAGQSSSNGASNAPRSAEVKISYYELLGLTRQATEDEIKKAYRRKALELHPDRNYGNEEAATKTFAEVQTAYQVLSDPQERAWYDSHESAILRGDDVGDEDSPTYSNVRMTSADDLVRMVRKFNSNVQFTDAPSGFFGYLREQFEQLANEEDAAADWENVTAPEYPTFGHRDDTHDDVVKSFYSAWANFATVKTFAWRDKYRLSEAPDRRIRRLMEKENNTARQEGIREFNEAVRALVAFIRKRDPRYTPSTQSEEDRQKTLRDAAAAQAARARAANEAKMNEEVPEWTKFREPEELEESEEEEEVVQEILECVACNKSFKSERQYEAHEKSKKHQKAVQALQRKMKKDNANLDLSGAGSGVETPFRDEDDYEFVDDEPAPEAEHLDCEDDTVGSEEAERSTDNEDEKVRTNEKDNVAEENQGEDASEKPKSSEDSSTSDEDDEYASAETVRMRLGQTSLTEPSTADVSEDEAVPATKKLGKAAQKRAKKAAAAASATPPENAEGEHKCAGCNSVFTSKTQLFQHLKDQPRHAALKTATTGGGKGKKGKGKK